MDGASVFDLANRRLIRFPGASLNHGWQRSRAVHLFQPDTPPESILAVYRDQSEQPSATASAIDRAAPR